MVHNARISTCTSFHGLTENIVVDAATAGVIAKPPKMAETSWLIPYVVNIDLREIFDGLACSIVTPEGTVEVVALLLGAGTTASMSTASENFREAIPIGRGIRGDGANFFSSTSTVVLIVRVILGMFFFRAAP
jgi:hypothetical protein